MSSRWLVVAAVLACAGTARADDVAAAKAHFRAATDAYHKADYNTAIKEFEAAYLAKPAGVLRYNIAQCYEKLGDIPSALRNYHLYLRETPNAEDRATVETAIANLEKRLQAMGVQQLVVTSEPSAAQVTVDGQARGATPLSVEVKPGSHQVSVAAEGYAPNQRSVDVRPDKSLELDVVLQKVSLNPPPQTIEQAANSPTTGTEQAAQPEHSHTLTWIAAGVSAAALAGGVVMGIAAKNNANTLHDPQQHSGVADLHKLNQDATDAANRDRNISNVLYGVGAAAGAGAVALFFVEGSF